MRYVIFALSVMVILFFASKVTASREMAVANKATALLSFDQLGKQLPPLEERVSFERAVEIREGENGSFETLRFSFVSVNESDTCISDELCRQITLSLSDDKSEESITLTPGQVVEYADYTLKLSQLAPLDNPTNVPYRAVLLMSSNHNK